MKAKNPDSNTEHESKDFLGSCVGDKENAQSKSSSNILKLKQRKSVLVSLVQGIKGTHTQGTDTPVHLHAVPTETLKTEPKKKPSLKQKFPKEYKSWDDCRDRAKQEGLPFDPAFEEFERFFSIVGPKPFPHYQLHKEIIELGYVQGNVRWVSPKENAEERDTTKWLTHDGQTHSIADWARLTNQSPNTLYARKKKGWSDSEVILGRSNLPCGTGETAKTVKTAFLLQYTPWTKDKAPEWEAAYQEEGRSGEHRLTFMRRKLKEGLAILQGQIRHFDPDHYEPSPEDLAANEKIRTRIAGVHSQMRHVARLYEVSKNVAERPLWIAVPDHVEKKLRGLYRPIP